MSANEIEPTPSISIWAKRDEATRRMFEACQLRFPSPEFQVECDDGGTVWVKNVDRSMSIGLQPWLLRTKSTEEVIERAEKKLGL